MILLGRAAVFRSACRALTMPITSGFGFFIPLLTRRDGPALSWLIPRLMRAHPNRNPAPFFDEILALQNQIQNLRRTCDLLLPCLLSVDGTLKL